MIAGTNVCPHGLEGDSGFGVSLNYIGDVDIVWDGTSGIDTGLGDMYTHLPLYPYRHWWNPKDQ